MRNVHNIYLSIFMRLRCTITWLFLVVTSLLYLNKITKTAGYRLARRHHWKRHNSPIGVYADFASINDIQECEERGERKKKPRETASVAMGSTGSCGAGAAGIGTGTAPAGAAPPPECVPAGDTPKCDVKEIITPGDPKTKSSNIAIKAAQEAKAANDAQQAAGQLAAQHIKQELAEKAFQSAKAAEAALTGKQMMVQTLEVETHEANAVVEQETGALQSAEANMNSAVEAARAATQQFEIFNELHKQIKDNLANIQAVALGAQQEVNNKLQLLEAAKNRLITMQKQMQQAQEDYEKTKAAAYKAACAAIDAKKKATAI